MNRKKIQFKIGKEVVLEDSSNMLIDNIEKMKVIIAEECQCDLDEVSVDVIDVPVEMSELDVSICGLFDWKDPYNKIISGIQLSIVVGSDEYLDALSDGSLEKYLVFN